MCEAHGDLLIWFRRRKPADVALLPPGSRLGSTSTLRTPNFGLKGLNEVKEVLASMGLRLGMDIPGWPPENIEEMAKKLEQELLG
jgi:hypothetical protein